MSESITLNYFSPNVEFGYTYAFYKILKICLYRYTIMSLYKCERGGLSLRFFFVSVCICMRLDRGKKLNVEILTVFDKLLPASDIPLHMTNGMIFHPTIIGPFNW